MRVSVRETAPCEKVLSIAVTGDLIRDEYNQFFERISKDARVPGFRPGKAPREVLEIHYRGEAREKVLERLISRSFSEAVGEKKLDFLGRPTIREIEFSGEKLSYEAQIEVPPTIQLGKYKGLAAERPPVEVKPEEISQALEQVRTSYAKFVAIENRPAAMGDFLIADYRCLIEGKEADTRNDDWFELREDEFLKGFSAQLVGAKPGEEREVRIQFPEKFGRKEWAGKEALFQVKVKEIKERKLAPLDDELAKETGEFETLGELREHLQRQIEAQKSKEAEREFENRLFDALLKENPFEVPRGVVERRQMSLTETAVESLHRQGVPSEAIRREIEKLVEKLKPEAERQVRLSFLLDAIAKQEKLEFTDSDFEVKYKEVAARHRQSEEPVRKYYQEHPEAKESLGIQILNEKVVQLLKENIKTGRTS